MKKLLSPLLAFGISAAVSAFGQTLFIHGADVYPVTGPEMKDVSVLVQDGKIADIGAKLVAPKGAKVLEAKGLRVYPGMIDSATELGLSEITAVRETEDTGEIGEFVPQIRALASVNPESEHFRIVRVNGITSVMTLPGSANSQLISGQSALIHTDGWTWEQMEIKGSAGMLVPFPTLGGRGGRGGGGGAPASDEEGGTGRGGAAGGFSTQLRNYQQQIKKLGDFLEEARHYEKAKEALAGKPGFKPDLRFDAMIPVLDGREPLTVTAGRERFILDAIKFADEQKVKLVILHPRELGKAAAELKAKNIPIIFGRVLELPNAEDDAYDQEFTLPLEAYKAGIRFAFGTFTENQFVRNLPYQAATAVAYGLPYEEALKAVTINPAEIWGVADKIGSIEKGKVADLLVTDGDPLEIQTHIVHLIISGKEVELVNHQTELYQKYLARP
jgi:imidazolonepropionase-like amidohydrolase